MAEHQNITKSINRLQDKYRLDDDVSGCSWQHYELVLNKFCSKVTELFSRLLRGISWLSYIFSRPSCQSNMEEFFFFFLLWLKLLFTVLLFTTLSFQSPETIGTTKRIHMFCAYTKGVSSFITWYLHPDVLNNMKHRTFCIRTPNF